MNDDEFSTMGFEDGFETLGDQGFETVGQAPYLRVPPAAMRQRPAAQQQRPALPAGAARFSPAMAAAFRASGISAEQARAIAREEIARIRATNPLVPWDKLPQRATPRDEAMWPLGLGVVTFDSTTGPTLTLAVTPQRPFRGERLVITTRRAGASAALPTVTISDLRVGDVPQRIGGGALPADIFAPDAFGVRLSLDASTPGVLVTLGFTLAGPALAPGDTITVAAGVIGRATEAGDR